MRSISGFNNSSLDGSFSPGQPISAAALNKLGTGTDITRTMASNDVQFTANTGGTTYSLGQQVYYGDTGLCSLQIYGLRYDAEADKYYINVTPGMVNNYGVTDHDDNPLTDNPPPNIQVFESGISTEFTTNYIYIACQNSGDPDYNYPDPDVPPYITVKDAIQADDDETAFFLIGIVKGKTSEDETTDTLEIYNYKGCGSLWTERFKCGTESAQYWWSGT